MNERDMREYVLKLVRDLIAKHGLPTRPTCLEVVAALELPKPLYEKLPSDKDGSRTGRQIIVNKQITCKKRVRFTFFHEVLHIVIEEDGLLPSELHEHGFVDGGEEAAQRVLESLCNLGAAEFLLPAALYQEFMADRGWDVGAIEAAAKEFNCSAIAAAFQFAHFNPRPCTVLVCEFGPIPVRSGVDVKSLASRPPCLHVAYTPFHPDSYPMCRHIRVPTNHLISRAWHTDSALRGEDKGIFKEIRQFDIPCEAVRIGDRVYAVFYPPITRRPVPEVAPNKHQLALFE
jgi:hypothetical protein